MSDSVRIKISYVEESEFGVADGVRSQGSLTLDTNPADGDTMTIDAKTYTFQTTLTDPDGNIEIGATLAVTQQNIINAIKLLKPVSGYGALMTLHPTVDVAFSWVANVLILTAKTGGVAGDTIVTIETFTATTNIFDADTLGLTRPGVDLTLNEMRLTSESLSQNTDTIVSAEIRDDRQISDVVRSKIQAQGDINLELSYGAYDDMLEAALFSAGWSSIVANTDTTYSMDASDNSLNDSGSQFVIDGFVVNQWIEIRGFTDAANNGYAKIVSITTAKIVLSGKTVVTEAAGDTVTLTMGGQIVNGTTATSFTFEKEHTDLDPVALAKYAGMMIDQLSLNITAEQIITGVLTFIGKQEEVISSTIGVAANNPAPANDIKSAVDDVLNILENQSDLGAISLSFQLINGLRPRAEIGELSVPSIGEGAFNVNGTLTAYFSNQGIIEKYLNFTETSIAILTEDKDGNAYIFDFPKVKYTSGTRNAGGQNTDIIADMAFQAIRDATEDITMRIARFVG